MLNKRKTFFNICTWNSIYMHNLFLSSALGAFVHVRIHILFLVNTTLQYGYFVATIIVTFSKDRMILY